MKVADEYRIQTTEGADWERAFREERTALARNEVEVAARREQLLRGAVQEIVGQVRPVHGEAKIRRRVDLRLHGDPDPAGSNAVGVQLGDEWSMSWAQVRDEALKRGIEDPVLHMHLPKQSAEELRTHIVAVEAARRVMDHRGTPASREGQEARTSMKSRLEGAEAARNEIVRTIVRSARVLQSGGAEIYGDDLASKLRTGRRQVAKPPVPALPRRRPSGLAAGAQAGAAGFGGTLQGGGLDGTGVGAPRLQSGCLPWSASRRRDRLSGEPWNPRRTAGPGTPSTRRSSRCTGTDTSRPNGTAGRWPGPAGPDRHLQGSVPSEKVRLTTGQRVELRKLFGKLGVKAKSGDEEDGGRKFLAALTELAARAGGDPPLPRHRTRAVDDISHLAGNEKLAAMLAHRDEIEEAIGDWGGLAERAEGRLTCWALAKALHRHACGELEIADRVGAQLAAIEEQRSLLEATDHVSPRLARVAGALRTELAARHGELCEAVEEAVDGLESDATWAKVEEPVRAEIRGEVGLVAPPALTVETDEA